MVKWSQELPIHIKEDYLIISDSFQKKLFENQLDSEDLIAMYKIGNQHRDHGNYEKAIKWHERLRVIKPNLPRLNEILGWEYSLLGNHHQALSYYKKIIEEKS